MFVTYKPICESRLIVPMTIVRLEIVSIAIFPVDNSLQIKHTISHTFDDSGASDFTVVIPRDKRYSNICLLLTEAGLPQ